MAGDLEKVEKLLRPIRDRKLWPAMIAYVLKGRVTWKKKNATLLHRKKWSFCGQLFSSHQPRY